MEATRTRRSTNITLPEELVEQAKELGINMSQAAERGIAATVAKARADLWIAQNGAGIEASNRHVERLGIPFAQLHARKL